MFRCIKKNITILSLFNTFKRNPKWIYSVYLNKGKSTSTNVHTKYMKREKISIIVLTTIIGQGIYWYFYPHNNYPRSVSQPLRNVLWQERKFKDFKTNIWFYIDDLEECNKLEMNKTDDEYTGVKIKMAEMFEKLNNLSKANEIHLTILNRLYNVLTTEANTEYSINNTYEQSKWDVLIKKGLKPCK